MYLDVLRKSKTMDKRREGGLRSWRAVIGKACRKISATRCYVLLVLGDRANLCLFQGEGGNNNDI